jgi:hypothetical protein
MIATVANLMALPAVEPLPDASAPLTDAGSDDAGVVVPDAGSTEADASVDSGIGGSP